MERTILKRAGIIGGLILIILGLSYACSLIVNDSEGPQLSDPNGVFMTFGDLSITNQQWYNRAKQTDGVNLLLSYVDEILFADEIAAVTQEEIDEVLLLLRFGSSDETIIERLSERDRRRLQQEFEDLVIVSGFDPSDEASLERFLRLNIARENFVTNHILNAGTDRPYHITDERLKTFYESAVRGDLGAVVLRFMSALEATSVLRHFNVVPNFEGGLGLYFGEEDIADLSSFDFNEDNTRLLNEAEVLALYLEMYNYLYPFRETLNTSASKQDLIALNKDALQFNFEAMTTQNNTQLETLALYLFATRDDENPFSIRAHTVGAFRVMALVFDRTEATPFESLTAAELDDLRTQFALEVKTENLVRTTINAFREERGFTLHDPVLASQFQQIHRANVFLENRDRQALVSFDDQVLTADDFLDIMARRVGALYSVEISKDIYLLQSAYFEALFGSNFDVWRNNTDEMRQLRNQVRAEKAAFNNGLYAQFGFSPQFMTWEEFLLFGFGVTSETEFLNSLVLSRLRPKWLIDNKDFSLIAPQIDHQVANYFSLNVRQILVFVDVEEDFSVDNYDVFLESLTPAERAAHEALVLDLKAEILAAHNDGEGLSFSQIFTEYNGALRGENEEDPDFSRWARFKNGGLLIRFENLSTEASLNFNNTRNFVAEFVEGLVAFYGVYRQEANRELESLVFNQPIQTQFGVHVLHATPGTGFDQPMIVPSEANVTAFHNAFLEFNTLAQSDEQLETLVREAIGADVFAGIQAYYQVQFSRLQSNPFANLVMMEQLSQLDVTFTRHAEAQETLLSQLENLFRRRVFPPID